MIGFLNSSGGWALYVDNSGNATAAANVTAYSDARLKDEIKAIPGALHRLCRVRGVEYVRKDTGRKEIGVVAQEIEQEFPEVVFEGSDGIKSVAYGNLVGALIEAVRELEERVRELEFKARYCQNCEI